MENLQDWTAYRKGDKAAFERIFRQYVRLLYKYGSRFTSDAGLVEDAIQELFIDLWEKRASIAETDSIKRYLLGALRRRIVRKLSQQAPLQASVVQDETENHDFELEANFEEATILGEIQEENKQKIQQALQTLSKRQKEIIYLKFYQQLSFAEIEETLGINYQSARNLLHKAMQAVKSVISTAKQLLLLFLFNFFS